MKGLLLLIIPNRRTVKRIDNKKIFGRLNILHSFVVELSNDEIFYARFDILCYSNISKL